VRGYRPAQRTESARCRRRQRQCDAGGGTPLRRRHVDRLCRRPARAATFQEADAEALPFKDGTFDVVLSTFGVMFTPNHEQAASELLRVCRKGGKIGLANWTPDSFIGQLFKTIGKYVPPAPGVRSPALWGNKEHLDKLFGTGASVAAASRHFTFRYRSAQHWLDTFRDYYGPVLKAFAAIDPAARAALEKDLLALLARFNTATDGTLVARSEYLEVIVIRN
jgi:SAM-dependent methyltransferase